MSTMESTTTPVNESIDWKCRGIGRVTVGIVGLRQVSWETWNLGTFVVRGARNENTPQEEGSGGVVVSTAVSQQRIFTLHSKIKIRLLRKSSNSQARQETGKSRSCKSEGRREDGVLHIAIVTSPCHSDWVCLWVLVMPSANLKVYIPLQINL